MFFQSHRLVSLSTRFIPMLISQASFGPHKYIEAYGRLQLHT
jgi:hypothetical protein